VVTHVRNLQTQSIVASARHDPRSCCKPWCLRSERRDDGVILVFWALCLPLLAVLFVGVIELGNLLQSSDNAKNAADAAALAAAGYLATYNPPPMVVTDIPDIYTDLGYRCLVGSDNTITRCEHQDYGWLYDYSIYEANEWVAISTPQDATNALRYANTAWSCPPQNRVPGMSGHRHHGMIVYYCNDLDIQPPAPGLGLNASLALNETVNQAMVATNTAISVEAKYGFTTYSGCTPPRYFFLAEASTATCIGYDAAGSIWVTIPNSTGLAASASTTSEKTSWATELPNGTTELCSGPPPGGNCD
jgi:hypothetical protein